jgi:transmembrane sensor
VATNSNNQQLFEKWIRGECTGSESEALIEWLGGDQYDNNTEAMLKAWFQHEVNVQHLDPKIIAALEAKLPGILSQTESRMEEVPIRNIYTRTNWIRYAAAIIIMIGIGTAAYLWNTQQQEKPSVTQKSPSPVKNDVAPGGNKATLTLADGTKIILDSAASGQLAREANATITKTNDGRIVYNADVKLGSTILFNTMATPRGGQFQLTLPDGTQVWLNAESSITYPTAFIGNERKVTITGEAYFEVTSDKKKPFKVECLLARHPEERSDEGSAKKRMTIEVLGTHFNVNSYKEEPSYNTTLLEGSVRLTLPTADSRLPNNARASLTLKPGQQAQLTDRGLFLATDPNVEQVMAWKNGVFNFDNMKLPEAMRQLSRWYDVQVVYEGKVPQITFVGSMGRDLNLSQVLKVLSALEVKFRIENRKLIDSK